MKPVNAAMSSRQDQFEALVRGHSTDLYRYAYWLCGQEALAQDLVQDTFLRAWRALDRLSITDRSITGRFDLNIFNKPTVEIDRTTGTIEIDGFGNTSYSGICERVEAQERRF